MRGRNGGKPQAGIEASGKALKKGGITNQAQAKKLTSKKLVETAEGNLNGGNTNYGDVQAAVKHLPKG